jgi:hypothetical protein
MFISAFLVSLLSFALIYRFVQKFRARHRVPVIRTKIPFDV